MLELALAALALWGWAGMHLTVEVGYPSQPSWVAEAWPTDDYSACRIVVHPTLNEIILWGIMLHEVGHCVGVYDHSTEAGSVMSGYYENGTVTRADIAASKAMRDGRLPHRNTLPGIAH